MGVARGVACSTLASPIGALTPCWLQQVRTLHKTYESIGRFAAGFPKGGADEVATRDLFVYLDPNCAPFECDTSGLQGWIDSMNPVQSRCAWPHHYGHPSAYQWQTPITVLGWGGVLPAQGALSTAH